MSKQITEQIIALYAQYIESIKRISSIERDEILNVLLKHRSVENKTHEKYIRKI